MPRTKAAFDLSYYDDPDVIALSPDAERLYMRLVISPTLSQAGTGPWQPRQLLRQLPDFDDDRLEQTTAELEQARFAYVDTTTEEIFVRALMRRDGVAKQPNVLNNACGVALLVRSAKLRPLVGRELDRIRREMYPDPHAADLKGPRRAVTVKLAEVVPVLWPDADANPSAVSPGNPYAVRVNQPVDNTPDRVCRGNAESSQVKTLRAEPLAGNPSAVTLSPKPHGEGAGEGVGEIITTEGGTGGEVARTRETPPPGNLDPANPRCPTHAHLPADDRGPNCLACRRVRQWCEQAPDRVADARRRVAAAARAAIDACTRCDDTGWLLAVDGTPIEPVIRCRHRATAEARHA
ncbi:hypothetical protein ACWIDS_16270 [Dietzia maris]